MLHPEEAGARQDVRPSTVACFLACTQPLESFVSNLLGKEVTKDTLALAVASNVACRNPPAVPRGLHNQGQRLMGKEDLANFSSKLGYGVYVFMATSPAPGLKT